jgi:hypothetical protein
MRKVGLHTFASVFAFVDQQQYSVNPDTDIPSKHRDSQARQLNESKDDGTSCLLSVPNPDKTETRPLNPGK